MAIIDDEVASSHVLRVGLDVANAVSVFVLYLRCSLPRILIMNTCISYGGNHEASILPWRRFSTAYSMTMIGVLTAISVFPVVAYCSFRLFCRRCPGTGHEQAAWFLIAQTHENMTKWMTAINAQIYGLWLKTFTPPQDNYWSQG